MTEKPKGNTKLKCCLGCLILAVLLVVTPVFVATFVLPKTYQASAQATLSQPPDKVWAAVQDPLNLPLSGDARQSHRSISKTGEPLAWEETMVGSAITVRTLKSKKPTLVVRELKDSVVAMTSTWTLTIAKSGDGSMVTLEQETTVEDGTWHSPVFRLILATGGAEAGPKEYLQRLEARLAAN